MIELLFTVAGIVIGHVLTRIIDRWFDARRPMPAIEREPRPRDLPRRRG